MGGYSSQNDSTHQTGLCQSMSYINFSKVHKLTLTQQCVFAQIYVKKTKQTRSQPPILLAGLFQLQLPTMALLDLQELLKALGPPLKVGKMPTSAAKMANSAWVKMGIKPEYIEVELASVLLGEL